MGDGLAAAVEALRRGALVVYPTDTLLGLGALASHRGAVRRLLSVKGRSSGQPVSVCLSSTEEVERVARVSPSARRFLRRHLPGPYTALLAPSPEGRRMFAPAVGGFRAIGFRVPDHPVARELARRAGPITATSANRHGAPATRTVAAARRALGRAVACYLPARPKGSGVPSTIVDLTGPAPRKVGRRSRSR
jgi:tRNA threonylcarbamoyl adenosine modification protein (Sua5/YciO/YrdC/YwlC family)